MEVFSSCAEFEVVSGDAQIHLGIADEGEMALGKDARQLAFLGRQEFKGELLLIDGRGSQQGGFDATAEPLGASLPASRRSR